MKSVTANLEGLASQMSISAVSDRTRISAAVSGRARCGGSPRRHRRLQIGLSKRLGPVGAGTWCRRCSRAGRRLVGSRGGGGVWGCTAQSKQGGRNRRVKHLPNTGDRTARVCGRLAHRYMQLGTYMDANISACAWAQAGAPCRPRAALCCRSCCASRRFDWSVQWRGSSRRQRRLVRCGSCVCVLGCKRLTCVSVCVLQCAVSCQLWSRRLSAWRSRTRQASGRCCLPPLQVRE
jgi:hypothetical protein